MVMIKLTKSKNEKMITFLISIIRILPMKLRLMKSIQLKIVKKESSYEKII